MKILIFIMFGLKMPIHAPVDLTPQMGSIINDTLKGISIERSTSYEV